MKEYQLEIKQIADYPKCRIYRGFIQSLIADHRLHAGPASHLFHYTVLCCYANFRTSYLRLEGVSYTIRPGEWICRVSDLMRWFRVRFQHQVLSILEDLQNLHLITFSEIRKKCIIRYRIAGWKKYNTVLDYNCPCQKESGFFFMPISLTTKLLGKVRASEMDILLDLWLNTIYMDSNVCGSDLGPVVYFRNGSGSPLLSYSDLAQRWRCSRSSVGRLLKRLSLHGYISLISFPGRNGSAIYLNSYLSVMFQISDTPICREAVAVSLNIHLPLLDDGETPECGSAASVFVSKELFSVPKRHINIITAKVIQTLVHQGFQCLKCTQSAIKLYPLSVNCRSVDLPIPEVHMAPLLGMDICCGDRIISRFTLRISPTEHGLDDGGNLDYEESL